MRHTMLLAIAALAPVSMAQVWGWNGASQTRSNIDIEADNDASGALGDDSSMGNDSHNGFGANAFGRDQGGGSQATAGKTIFTCPTRADALAWVAVDGVGTPIVTIEFEVNLRQKHDCCEFAWLVNGVVDLTADIILDVNGVAAGTPIDVDYVWSALALNNRKHEAGGEDPQNVFGDFAIDGASITTGALDMPEPSFPGNIGLMRWRVDERGSYNATAPYSAFVDVDAHVDGMLTVPGIGVTDCPPHGWHDFSAGSYYVKLVMSLVGPPAPIGLFGSDTPVPPGYRGDEVDVMFSLDIGSDSEFSDPNMDGDENFDPGDVYAWRVPLAGPSNGVFDDQFPFAFQPHFPDPGTPGAPTCSGFPPLQLTDYLDVDGTDALDRDLSQLIRADSALDQLIRRFDSYSIFDVNNLVLSLEDDSDRHYATCDVPVSVTSSTAKTRGTAGARDEVFGAIINDYAYPGSLMTTYPILDERDLNPSLVPDPTLWSQDHDDDVDALDVEWKAGFGRYWYFSVDHEANPNFALDPGAIYMYDGVSLRLVIDENVHLGLPESTDIDAFEFVWQAGQDGDVLAVVFSVDEDDPQTPQDESGGLHPGRLYTSTMHGAHVPLVQEIIGDDIDAIGAWWDTFFPRNCNVDLNGDTILDIFDVLDFLGRFSNNDPSADWNGDGIIDIFDVLAFLGDFSAGCP